jgi:hypothetical protein
MATYPRLETAEIAQRYLALVERICLHFTELCESGRWKHYYDEEQLLAHARELTALREKWTALAEQPQTLERWEDTPTSIRAA